MIYAVTEENAKMVNLNKYTKTKPKPKLTCRLKNCSRVCAYHCAQLLYTTQHRTGRIIFPPNLQRIITAELLSYWREGGIKSIWQQLINSFNPGRDPSCTDSRYEG